MPAPLNITGYLHRSARGPDGNRVAISHPDGDITYAEMVERVAQAAGTFRSVGVGAGDRVLLVQRNGPEFYECLFAAWALGAAAVPLNSALHPAEIEYIARDSGSKVIVQDQALGGELRRRLAASSAQVDLLYVGPDSRWPDSRGARPIHGYADVTDEQSAWLFYTSGTTGKPKGVIWSHTTLNIMILALLADVFPTLSREDSFVHLAPMTHGSGMLGLVAFARALRTVVAPSGPFSGDAALDLIDREAITNVAFLAPLQLARLTSAAAEHGVPASLNRIPYGGAPISGSDLGRAVRVFGRRLVQLYAQGECLTTTTILTGSDHERALVEPTLLLSSGRPRSGVDVRVVDDAGTPRPPGVAGEVTVRGSIVMRGYWEQPAASAAAIRDGWLRTGDIGYMDDQDYLYLLDRSKDVIVSGGMNIYPREVEEVIAAIPGVEMVCVVGVPNDVWGESVHAIVVRAENGSATAEDIERACLGGLARFKRPRTTEFRATLPMNAHGKVLRRELRAEFWSGRRRNIGGEPIATDGAS